MKTKEIFNLDLICTLRVYDHNISNGKTNHLETNDNIQTKRSKYNIYKVKFAVSVTEIEVSSTVSVRTPQREAIPGESGIVSIGPSHRAPHFPRPRLRPSSPYVSPADRTHPVTLATSLPGTHSWMASANIS